MSLCLSVVNRPELKCQQFRPVFEFGPLGPFTTTFTMVLGTFAVNIFVEENLGFNMQSTEGCVQIY